MLSNLNIRQAVDWRWALRAPPRAHWHASLRRWQRIGRRTECRTAPAPAIALQEIVVTGSRVRRVDAETADPVLVLDQSTIAQSGAVTMGDLVNRIPSIAGAAMSPRSTTAAVSANPTLNCAASTRNELSFIDGCRVNLAGSVGAVDVN